MSVPFLGGLAALHQARQWGNLETAARDITLRHPLHPIGWSFLGLALQGLERLPEAVAALEHAARLAPRDAGTHGNLGAALKALGRHAEAEVCYRKALAIRPDHAGLHYNLGNLLQDLGRLQEAEASYRYALALRPGHAKAQANLGNVLQDLGRLQKAEAAFRCAVEIDPGSARAHNNLGNLLEALGRHAEAETCCRRAIEIDPSCAGAYNNLGNTLQSLGRFADAEASYRRALAINPDYAEAHSNLGNVLQGLGSYEEAEAAFRRAIRADPGYTGAYSNLGNLLQDLCRFPEAEASYRRALEIRPGDTEVWSNLLLGLLYEGVSPAAYYEEALAYGRVATSLAKIPFTSWICPECPRRLRVGLVSGDLRRHAVSYFVEGVLAHLDPARVELIAYPTVPKEDDLTARLRPRFAEWRLLFGLDDEAAARRIHEDGVHVLIDLSGHLAHNRLPVFAWRPAPVQASWMGYVATTGLSEMDWFIADPHVAPPGEGAFFRERLWCLPETWLCFTPPDVAVEVGPLPAVSTGGVTFGSFNNLKKMNDAVVAAWAKILEAVPGSRLFLKTQQLADAAVREAVLGHFAGRGIDAERLLLEGHTARRESHYEAYNRVDIGLDPFPFVGITTSVESLWMGVPFVTRRGDSYLSRTGESVLENAGLADWIARDDDEYVAKAVALAADLDRLAALRDGLRARVLASPLFDAPRFARALEDALWGMWEDRDKGQG